jgi:hypothetical protein
LIACYTKSQVATGGTVTVTDGHSNGYTGTATAQDSGSIYKTQWFTAVNNASGSMVVTENDTASNTMDIHCVEYTGGTGATDVVKAGNNGGAATVNITTGSFTTTGSSDLILVGLVDYGAQNCSISPEFTAGASYSMVSNDFLSNCGPMAIEAQSAVAAGSHTGTATDSVSTTTWQAYAISFIAGGSTILQAASVNSNGLVTGLNPGTSTISVNAGAINQSNVCTNNNSLTGQLSIPCVFPKPVGSKDTIVCTESSNDTSSSYSVPTDSAGNTYLLISPSSSAPSHGTGLSQAVYYSQGVAASATDTVTAVFGSGGASSPSIVCSDMLGLSGGVDAQAVATGNNNLAQNSVTAAAASDVIFSAVNTPSGIIAVPTNTGTPSPQLIGNSGGNEMQYTRLFATGAWTDNAALNFGANWLMNSVMLKSVALGTSTITVSTSTPSSYTITNQQPDTTEFYPGTIFTTALPADVASHCWTNVPCGSSDPSIAIINNIFGSSDTAGGYISSEVNTAVMTNSNGNGFYYSGKSDPVFRVNAGSGPCPPLAINCGAGKYLHIPSGAQYDACHGDELLLVWDQSTDIDSTVGGRILETYSYNSGTCATNALSTTCTATTPAQADAQPACQLNLYYNAVNFPFNDPTGIGDGINSAGFGGGVGVQRELEVENNVMNHALMVNVACLQSTAGNGVANAPVFPATGNAIGCNNTNVNNPLEGMLFYIDSAYNCTTLPAWQKPFCTALKTYGGYLDATGGAGYQTGLFVTSIEGGTAHTTANLNDPMFNEPNAGGTTAWIITNGVTSCPGGGYPKVCTGTNGLEVVEDSATSANKIVWFLFQMPGLITGQHLHIVDPCLVKRMAGQPGAC